MIENLPKVTCDDCGAWYVYRDPELGDRVRMLPGWTKDRETGRVACHRCNRARGPQLERPGIITPGSR